jgi:hypothetical protein
MLVLFSRIPVGRLSAVSLSPVGVAGEFPTNILDTFNHALNAGVTNLFRSSARSGLTVMSSAMIAMRRPTMRMERMIDAKTLATSANLT